MRCGEIAAFGPPEGLRLVERPTPLPAAGEVLIEVHAAGVNRRTPSSGRQRSGLRMARILLTLRPVHPRAGRPPIVDDEHAILEAVVDPLSPVKQ